MRHLLVGGLLLVTTGLAQADPTRADALIAQAESLAKGTHFVEAAKAYRAAYTEDPRPELICNVGISYYKGKDLPHADRYLAACIATGASLDAAFIANLKEVLAVVETGLRADRFTPVEIVVSPTTASLALEGSDDEPFVGSSHLWLRAGDYRLAAHAEGYADQTLPIHVASGAPISLTVKLEIPTPSRRPAVIATIGTAVIGLAAGGAYAFALHRASQSGDARLLSDHDHLADSAHMYQHLAWGLGIAAALGAGLTTYLWIRSSPAHVEVAPVAGGAAVSLAGTW